MTEPTTTNEAAPSPAPDTRKPTYEEVSALAVIGLRIARDISAGRLGQLEAGARTSQLFSVGLADRHGLLRMVEWEGESRGLIKERTDEGLSKMLKVAKAAGGEGAELIELLEKIIEAGKDAGPKPNDAGAPAKAATP